MRKVYLFGLIETGLLVMGIEFVPPPWLLPILIGIFAVFGILTIWAYRPEIRKVAQWVTSPGYRAYCRGIALQEREEALRQDAIPARIVDVTRSLPFDLQTVSYDPVTGNISGEIASPRRTWRGWVMHCADWLANHHWLPFGAWLWLGKRLGYKFEERDGRG